MSSQSHTFVKSALMALNLVKTVAGVSMKVFAFTFPAMHQHSVDAFGKNSKSFVFVRRERRRNTFSSSVKLPPRLRALLPLPQARKNVAVRAFRLGCRLLLLYSCTAAVAAAAGVDYCCNIEHNPRIASPRSHKPGFQSVSLILGEPTWIAAGRTYNTFNSSSTYLYPTVHTHGRRRTRKLKKNSRCDLRLTT